MIRSYIITLLIFISSGLLSQSLSNIGLPFISNFDRNDYNAGTQNWCIAQDAEQVMWFGNNNMLLWYDGVEWGKVSIPNFSVARSLLSTTNDQLLVGAFQEFGQIDKASNGIYTFNSWLSELPQEYHNFTNILKIHELNGEYYFESEEYIFVFKDKQFQRAYTPENSFHFSFVANSRFYVVDKQIGLKQLESSGLNMTDHGDFFSDKEIWFLDYFRGKLLAITQKQGMYIYTNGRWKAWNCSLNERLKKHIFYTGLINNNNKLIVGTVQNGLIISDENGEIKQHINTKRGLSNNTVLSMHMDIEDNLWLGLDHGISYLKTNSPLTQLVNEEGFGTGYASAYHNKTLYLGTNQGLYYGRIRNNQIEDYHIIEGSEGQVWSLQELNGTLFCSHHNGLYTISDNTINKIEGTDGCWKIMAHPTLSDTYIVGSYLGIGVITKKDGEYSYRKIDGFEESSRVMVFDIYNNLWMSHGYKGVYKIALNEDLTAISDTKYFGKEQGLFSNENNEVFKFNDQIAVAGIDKVYIYNPTTGKMEPYTQWNDFYPLHTQISKIFNNNINNRYIFSDNKLHKATFQKGSLQEFDSHQFLPLEGSFLAAFENISFITDELFIIGVVDGFVLYNSNVGRQSRIDMPLNIKELSGSSNSTFNYTSNIMDLDQEIIEIPYASRNLNIKYAIPLYETPFNINSEVKLNGNVLSPELTSDYTVKLNRLDYGTYDLEFIATDLSGIRKETVKTMSIKILPPWYLTWYMVLVWITLSIGILLTIYLFAKKRVETIRRREKLMQQKKMIKEQRALKRKADKAEQQMTHLKNETLKKQNRTKAEEIANSTMELVEKNKMLLMVKDTLKNIQDEKDIKRRNSIIRQMLKTIDRDLNNKEKWKIFEENFDEVHEDFLNRFKEKHPNITAKDMRLCAFLRMNLSSKEIAPLLSISIRSVEISRYRLRKKIELEHDINLTDYIVHF